MQPKMIQPKLVPLPGGKPKLIADGKIETDMGIYDVETWDGKNESGFIPIGDRVLVMPYQPSKTSGTGLIEIPPEMLERIAYAAELGVIIAVGDAAFVWNSSRTRPWEGAKPEPGWHVFFERYAGGMVRGADGRMYRCMDDKNVGLKCTD